MGTSEYIYDQCGYNPQSSDQAQLLLQSAAPAGAAAEAPTAANGGADVGLPAVDFGPLGFEQMWCGARQGAQPVWNALPAVAAAMHMKPFAGNALSYTSTRTGPGSDLRPLPPSRFRPPGTVTIPGPRNIHCEYSL